MAIVYEKNVALAPLTTFGVGGAAARFVEVRSDDEIEQVFAENRGSDIFVLGGGSNVLIADSGFDGLVIKIGTRGVTFEETDGGDTIVTAQAGEDWDEFVDACVKRDLAGLECLSGIPGLVGGTPIQNVGAYGQEVSETVVSVRALERSSGKLVELTHDDCGFEYRKSIFNNTEKDRYVVLSVKYRLISGGEPKIAYSDLKTRLKDTEADLTTVRKTVCEIRASKGMLVRQGGADSRSAGSFFKNPIVELVKLREIAKTLDLEEGSVPRYEMGGERYKVPAAWLIEKAGFTKGYRKGNAGISNLHSLALTNRGGATAKDLIRLKTEIENRISDEFGIRLVNEPNLIGFG